jgi:hypothetical protein
MLPLLVCVALALLCCSAPDLGLCAGVFLCEQHSIAVLFGAPAVNDSSGVHHRWPTSGGAAVVQGWDAAVASVQTVQTCCTACHNTVADPCLSHVAAAAAVWFAFNRREGVDIQDAYKLLSPTLGARGASIIFALALLASGQNSTITGTLAGQVVMEGFLQVCYFVTSTIIFKWRSSVYCCQERGQSFGVACACGRTAPSGGHLQDRSSRRASSS